MDKLSPEKRKKVLDRLTEANVISADLKTKQSTTETQRKQPTKNSQDEVEILDMHNPKMGIYKKKRSKLLLFLVNTNEKACRDEIMAISKFDFWYNILYYNI